jgi:hypothetical protein
MQLIVLEGEGSRTPAHVCSPQQLQTPTCRLHALLGGILL